MYHNAHKFANIDVTALKVRSQTLEIWTSEINGKYIPVLGREEISALVEVAAQTSVHFYPV